MLLMLVSACILSREDFVTDLSEVLCAQAIDCGSSLDYDVCVYQDEMGIDEAICDYSA